MLAWTTIRWRRTSWHLCPWFSIRSFALSLMAVVTAALVADRWVIPSLEKRGLVASDGWKQHNQVVIENHQRKDRQISFPRLRPASAAGVRSWIGHPVTRERTKPHRILVMGDSFVWGSPYLTSNHTWWRQLCIELQRRGYHDVEVIAAGTAGMSTHDELSLAEVVVSEFKPDLILWGFVTNDPDERIVKQINDSQLTLPIPDRIQKTLQWVAPRLFDLFKSRRSEKLAKSYLGSEYGYPYAEWLVRIHEGENFERYRQTVASVSQFLKDIQTPCLMVTLPNSPISEDFAFSYDKVVPLWRDAGIPVQDNLPEFARRFPQARSTGPQAIQWGINPADGHPGPHSTAELASLTADRLEHDYSQFIGAKSSPHPDVRINDWLPFDLDVTPVGQGKFTLSYPASDSFMPTMPLGIPTVLVALEQPQPIQQIHLSGTGLKSARVWLSTYDPESHYDTEEWKDLGVIDGKELAWKVPAELSRRRASVVLLRADFQTSDHQLTLEMTTGESEPNVSEGPR